MPGGKAVVGVSWVVFRVVRRQTLSWLIVPSASRNCWAAPSSGVMCQWHLVLTVSGALVPCFTNADAAVPNSAGAAEHSST